MYSFSGTYCRTIDSKGRIFIPSLYRNEFRKGIMISKGYGLRCLSLYSMEKYEELNDMINKNKVAEGSQHRFKRWFYSSTVKEKMDQQGRVKIPQNLIDYAMLKRNIAIVGVSSRLEVWDKENWIKYDMEAESRFRKNPAIFEKLEL